MSKALKSFRYGTQNYRRGQPVEVSEAVAKDLAKRGLIEGSAAPKKKAEPDGLEAMTVDQLKAHAAEKGFDLGDATKKADIIAAIEKAAGE
jgi:hypothetical protein